MRNLTSHLLGQWLGRLINLKINKRITLINLLLRTQKPFAQEWVKWSEHGNEKSLGLHDTRAHELDTKTY